VNEKATNHCCFYHAQFPFHITAPAENQASYYFNQLYKIATKDNNAALHRSNWCSTSSLSNENHYFARNEGWRADCERAMTTMPWEMTTSSRTDWRIYVQLKALFTSHELNWTKLNWSGVSVSIVVLIFNQNWKWNMNVHFHFKILPGMLSFLYYTFNKKLPSIIGVKTFLCFFFFYFSIKHVVDVFYSWKFF